MSHPLRDFVIAPKEVRKMPVEFGGQTVYVKKLKAREVRDIVANEKAGDKGIHPQIWWIIGGYVDETGKRVFEWGDAEHLNELEATEVMWLHDKVIEFNAADKSPDEIAKNS